MEKGRESRGRRFGAGPPKSAGAGPGKNGGTGPRALIQFLHDNPHVTQVSLCLDNDKAGLEGMERLTQEIQNDAELSRRVKLVYPNPPKQGKDYNEFLCTHVKAVRTAQRQRDAAR